jgi:16S rRNA (cytosine967-C5)-methyltransferase
MLRKDKARAIAFRILQRVEGEGAWASLLLQNVPPQTPPAEMRLVTELVYGALRHRLRDERTLELLAGRPITRIDDRIAILFRIAAHQLLRLDRVPDHAAVNEAVETARTMRTGGAAARAGAQARFLNAVLRRLSREGEPPEVAATPSGDLPEGERVRRFAIHWSHPEWVVKRWMEKMGPAETALLLAAGNERPPLAARVDTARTTIEAARLALAAEGVTSEPSDFPEDSIRITGGTPQRTSVFARGGIYIQDEASGLVPLLLAPEPGARVLDACAAPGGKSLVLARMAGPSGRVVAAEIHPSRAGLITSNARRHGVASILTVACDITMAPFSAPFDAVLVDAPCSGTGVFRRDPESRYRLRPEDLDSLVKGQEAILNAVAPLVKVGGRLVYSVCSLEPEEGEGRVEEFLSAHAGFSIEPVADRLHARPDLVGADGAMRTLPHRHDMDGFYAASLARRR